MIALNLCHSAMKAQNMKDKNKHFSALDGLYLLGVLILVSFLINHVEIKFKGLHEVKAQEIVKQEIIKEVVKVTHAPDQRITKLRNFLISKNSPLAPYSELIIDEADKYDIGWTKIVSISGMESAFGLKLPYNSHNAWGLGGSKFMYFSSWDESIRYVSRLIGTSYKTNEFQAIKSKYCPASDGCNPAWVFTVISNSSDILGIE